jgi:hypothetical protein
MTYSIVTYSERDKYNDPVHLFSFRDAHMAWTTWRSMLPELPPKTILSRWDGTSTLTMAVKS